MNYVAPLFLVLLERLVPGADPKVLQVARQEYERYKSSTDIEATEAAMVRFGKAMWPYWKAFYEFSDDIGKKAIHDAILAELPGDIAKRYNTFIKEEGGLEDGKNSAAFENAFTPDENLLLQDAIISGKKKMEKMFALQALSEKKENYLRLVNKYKEKQEAMNILLDTLVAIKSDAPKWADEIDEEVAFFRKGFAEIEATPTEEAIQERINWYQGQIESGNV